MSTGRYNVTLRYADKRQSIYGPSQERLEEALHKGLEHDPHRAALEGMEIDVATRWDAIGWLIGLGLVALIILVAVALIAFLSELLRAL